MADPVPVGVTYDPDAESVVATIPGILHGDVTFLSRMVRAPCKLVLDAQGLTDASLRALAMACTRGGVRHLSLRDNDISNLAGLTGTLPGYQAPTGNPPLAAVADRDPLPSLRALHVDGNRLRTLAPLAMVRGVRVLTAARNRIASLAEAQFGMLAASIEILDVSSNLIEEVELPQQQPGGRAACVNFGRKKKREKKKKKKPFFFFFFFFFFFSYFFIVRSITNGFATRLRLLPTDPLLCIVMISLFFFLFFVL
jgi:hypothetical protein